MNRKQRRTSTKTGDHGPLPSPAVRGPAGIAELLRRAVAHHQAGQLAQAEDCYRKILAIDENHFQGLHLLGVLAQQVGRSDLAERLIGKALTLHERNPAHPNGGACDLEVRVGSQRTIARRDLAEVYSNLSIVLMSLGRPTEALKAIQRSIAFNESDNTKLLFVQCVQALKSPPEGVDIRDDLARALSEPWGRPDDLAAFAAKLIKRDGEVGAAIRRFIDAGSGQEIVPAAELTELCRDRLLRSLLEATFIFDVALERYLTSVRKTMLEMAGRNDEVRHCEKDMLRFFCALSRQCYINEYVFACSEQEKERVGRLQCLMSEALDRGESIPELWPIAIAAYVPLASLSTANLLARKRWSAPVAVLVATHVQEVEQERQLRDSLQCLTTIDEPVSLAVKDQYEKNPYPRWVKASPVGQPTTIASHLKEQFPNLDFRHLPRRETPDVLIAGCGTGRHSIETARRFKGARVLAIDLSLASLCYAKRKTREVGLKNIEYAQADILQIGGIGRTFDLIEASGVLHHLSDPIAGWRVLLSLLRPGGFMRLGLYSAVARRVLADARTFIAQRGYGFSADDIRRARQELMRVGEDAPVAKVTHLGDFFSTSTCRDMLFHVQEHEMSLLEIERFLRQSNLRLLGFVLPNEVRGNYRARFPNDHAMTDLALWHVYEMENPTTFTGMY